MCAHGRGAVLLWLTGVLSVWLVPWVGEQSEEVVSVSTPLTPEADEVKNKGNEAFGGGWHLGRRGRGGGTGGTGNRWCLAVFEVAPCLVLDGGCGCALRGRHPKWPLLCIHITI